MRGKGEAAVEKLEWVLDSKARENIDKAVETVSALAKDSEGKMLWYDEYGVEWIKKVGTLSFSVSLSSPVRLLTPLPPESQASSLPTRTFRWPFNSRITRPTMSPSRRMRPPRPACSSTAEPRSFEA
jgi:hypothetical protein